MYMTEKEQRLHDGSVKSFGIGYGGIPKRDLYSEYTNRKIGASSSHVIQDHCGLGRGGVYGSNGSESGLSILFGWMSTIALLVVIGVTVMGNIPL